MRHKLLLAYDGTGYSGWQIQEKPDPPPTIQGELEKALKKLTGDNIRVTGSGRTDAGVHAHGQVAHFSSQSPKITALPDLRHTLNALLPASIRVISAEPVSDRFHAQHDATAKTYIYQLWTERTFIPPHLLNYVWSCGPLSEQKLTACASLFQGERDFASFQNSGGDIRETRRKISAVSVAKIQTCEWYPPHAPLFKISITANGFLKQMARNIVGFIVAVAQDKITPDRLEEIFSSRDRKALPTPTAPARGLFLARVEYSAD